MIMLIIIETNLLFIRVNKKNVTFKDKSSKDSKNPDLKQKTTLNDNV